MTTTELIATAPPISNLTVVKRDGRTLTFDDSRIRTALHKAFEAAFGEVTSANENAIANLTLRMAGLAEEAAFVCASAPGNSKAHKSAIRARAW